MTSYFNSKGKNLIIASRSGDSSEVRRLIKVSSALNYVNDLGQTPVFAAASNGKVEVLEILHEEAKADLNQPDTSGRTPICAAACEGHHKAVEFLIAHGADLDAADASGWTPVYGAACGGHDKALALLITAGANTALPSKMGSPLEAARG